MSLTFVPTGATPSETDLVTLCYLGESVERRHVVVHGFVQGVGFRYAVERAARHRGVAGWVRNRPDGTVEAVFEGEADAVEALLRLCQEGPRGAEVTRVEVDAESPEGLDGFRIAR
jgi:acylphosphatase